MALEREYEYLLQNAPVNGQSAQTAQAANALAQAENAAAANSGYSQAANSLYDQTADARLDRAINEALVKSGYKYDISRDKAYQDFARAYSQNALNGRTAAAETANQLAGGYAPTYADAVGSEVYGDTAGNVINYKPMFESAARQEAAAGAAQAIQSAQMLSALRDADYQKARDRYGDVANYMNYLASRYGTERQADIQRGETASDIYRARLSGAQQNLSDAQRMENTRYQFDNQSAESRAKLSEDAYEFGRKMDYTAAKDAYDDRVAAQKAAQQAAQKEAQAQEKASAAKLKEQQKAAVQLDKDKTTYGRAAHKIQKAMEGNYTLTANEEYDFDYNKDGKVDNSDLVIASRAAETGKIQYNYDPSVKANKLIDTIRRTGSHYGTLSEKTLERLIKNAGLNYREAAYVYRYFGL